MRAHRSASPAGTRSHRGCWRSRPGERPGGRGGLEPIREGGLRLRRLFGVRKLPALAIQRRLGWLLMKNDEEKWRFPSVGWSWGAIEIDYSGVGVRGLMLGLKDWVAAGVTRKSLSEVDHRNRVVTLDRDALRQQSGSMPAAQRQIDEGAV